MRSPRHAHPPADVRALSPDFEPPHFRQALSRFATGVTVVTTHAPGATKGQSLSSNFVGITASSFNSVSLSPPAVSGGTGSGSGGNPDLKPETSRTLEAGLHWQGGASALSVTAFANHFRNRVVSFDTGRPDPRVPTRNVYVYDNLAAVKLAGLELEGRTRLTSSLSLEGHYTFTQSRREGGLETSFAGLPLDGEPLAKTPVTSVVDTRSFVGDLGAERSRVAVAIGLLAACLAEQHDDLLARPGRCYRGLERRVLECAARRQPLEHVLVDGAPRDDPVDEYRPVIPALFLPHRPDAFNDLFVLLEVP